LSSFFSSAGGVALGVVEAEPLALPLADGVLDAPDEGALLDEDDESLDDGAADDVPVELPGGVAADGAGVAGAVDCGGVDLLSVLPSSLPHAESARATAAANSSEVLFIFNTSFKEGVMTDCYGFEASYRPTTVLTAPLWCSIRPETRQTRSP
jgi:hypothetical protein